MVQLARRASLIVLLLLFASADLAAGDDFNWWTLWSRNAAGEWTPSSGRILGAPRRCLEILDDLQHLHAGAQRTRETVLFLPLGARRTGREGLLTGLYLPTGPLPAEVRCLADPDIPRELKRK
jgi:hypothetical protein